MAGEEKITIFEATSIKVFQENQGSLGSLLQKKKLRII